MERKNKYNSFQFKQPEKQYILNVEAGVKQQFPEDDSYRINSMILKALILLGEYSQRMKEKQAVCDHLSL